MMNRFACAHLFLCWFRHLSLIYACIYATCCHGYIVNKLLQVLDSTLDVCKRAVIINSHLYWLRKSQKMYRKQSSVI